MHPSNALQLESDDPRSAARAVLTAIDYLVRWGRKVDLALQVIELFQAYGRYSGTPEHRSSMIVSQVCGVSGDCHMLRGEVELAAAWYQLSVRHSNDTGFPRAYARLVIDHKLHDHVPVALDAFRKQRAAWLERPWRLRARDILLSFAWLNNFHPRWIRDEIRDRNLLKQLEGLAGGEH